MSASRYLGDRGRTLGAAVLMAVLTALVSHRASAEAARRLRVARRIGPPDLAFASPLGVAFSPRTNSFMVAPVEGPASLQALTRLAEPDGIDTLELRGADALNLAFDSLRGRLLTLSGHSLLALATDGRGRPGRGAPDRFNIAHLGLTKPAGLTVLPETGTIYFLDSAIPRLVQVDPTADGGIESATVSYHELFGIPADQVRGMAFDPSSRHLFLLAGSQTLYETSATGELLLTHDISAARLRSPGGMVVAPTGDQTDDPAAQSLYIADGGSASTPGSLVELTLAPMASAQAVTTFTSSVMS